MSAPRTACPVGSAPCLLVRRARERARNDRQPWIPPAPRRRSRRQSAPRAQGYNPSSPGCARVAKGNGLYARKSGRFAAMMTLWRSRIDGRRRPHGQSSARRQGSFKAAATIGRPGGVPEWPKGTGCKPVGSAYGGSNPPAPIRTLRSPAALRAAMMTSQRFTFPAAGHATGEARRSALTAFRLLA